MNSELPRVISVRNYRGGVAGIAFEDGHELLLTGYSDNGSFGDCSQDLEKVELRQDGYRLVEYNSRKHHAGPQLDEHAVAAAVDGFDPQTLATYLEAARTQVQLEAAQIDGDDRWFAWKLLDHANTDIAVLRCGRFSRCDEAPAPTRLPSAEEVNAERAAEEARYQRRRDLQDEQDVVCVVRALCETRDRGSLEERTRNTLTPERLERAVTTLKENGQVEIQDGTPRLTEQAMRGQRMATLSPFGDCHIL